MRILTVIFLALFLSSCSSVTKYWPRSHDAEMFSSLVHLDISISDVDCDKPNWEKSHQIARHLSKYIEWRNDPQTENMQGLVKHIERMNQGGSKTFCELGKRTAQLRIAAAKTAWSKR